MGCMIPLPALACREAVLLEPAAGLRVSSQELPVRWKPLDGVFDYRLQAEARLPEGGIEWSVDLIVNGTDYRLRLPPSSGLLAVKLRVSAGCVSVGTPISALPARILIDRR